MHRLLVTFFACVFALAAHGGGYTLLSADIPPYSSSNANNEGLCIDIARAIFGRAGIDLDVAFYPWARSQKMTIAGQRYVITPLTRTPEREPHYDWIVPIYSYRLQFVANNPSVPIDDFDAIRGEEICVLRESPAEYKLKALGFDKRLAVTQGATCMQLLALGRTRAALVHGMLDAVNGYKKFGYDPAELRQGISFPSGDIYIGSSKGALSQEQRQQLIQAMDEIKRDGLYDLIIEKYN